MKKIFYVLTLLITTLTFGFTPTNATNVGSNVTIRLQDKAFLVEGNGKIDLNKFREYIKEIVSSQYNTEEYTIRFTNTNIKFPDNSYYLFSAEDSFKAGTELLTLIDLPSGFDTSNVNSFRGMFAHVRNANPDVSGFNLTKAIDISHMFKETNKFNPNVTNWQTNTVENMSWMFYNAKAATPNVTNWNTSNTKDMAGLFSNADKANPDLSNWDFSKVNSVNEMFKGAKSAEVANILNLANFKNSEPINNMLAGTPLYDEQIAKLKRSYPTQETKYTTQLNAGTYEQIKEVINLPDIEYNRVKDLLKQKAEEYASLPNKSPEFEQFINESKQLAENPKAKYDDLVQKLDKIDKELAKEKVNKLDELTKAQKEYINNEIDKSSNPKALSDEAETLNGMMKKAKRLMNEQVAEAERSPATNELLKVYQGEVKVLVEQSVGLKPNELEAKMQQVEDTLTKLKEEVEADKKLDKYRDQIDQLTNLTPGQKERFKKELKNSTPEEVVEKAQKLDEQISQIKVVRDKTISDKDLAPQYLLDQLKTYEVETNELIALDGTKDDEVEALKNDYIDHQDKIEKLIQAKKDINALDYLPKDIKTKFKNKIDDKLIDKTEYPNIVEEAKQLNESIKNIRELMEKNIPNKELISPKTAKALREKIEEGAYAITEGNKANIDAKKDEIAELIKRAEKEIKAKQDIDALKVLTEAQKQKYKDKIDEATAIDQIQPIVDTATKVDTEKGKAIATIYGLTHLNAEQKVYHSSKLDKVDLTESEIQPIVDTATTLDTTKKTS